MTSDELDLVETEELIKTLARRFDSYLFVLIQSRDDSAEERGFYYGGGIVTAIGMTEWAKHCLLHPEGTVAQEMDETGDD